MSSEEPTAFERGQAMIREVYAGSVADIPKGLMPFNDVMIETLFAEVWTRDVLSIRDRRLLLMGVIAAQGQTEVWKIQARAALDRQELTADELRETLVMLAPYAGYPNVAGLVGEAEGVIAEHAQAAGDG
ncbi:MAG: carboxymuconolactone decarboxylase family protein [Acidimicrobiales bacterium]